MVEVPGIQCLDFACEYSGEHVDAGIPEGCHARSGDAVVGIDRAHDDTTDPRRDDRIRTRRCAACVIARLEGHDHRVVWLDVTVEGVHFSVGTARADVATDGAHSASSREDDRPDAWIGMRIRVSGSADRYPHRLIHVEVID